jgi:hypothetical protein
MFPYYQKIIDPTKPSSSIVFNLAEAMATQEYEPSLEDHPLGLSIEMIAPAMIE